MTSYTRYAVDGGVPIKAWTRGVPVEAEALQQLKNVARLPIVHRWVAAMPDVHLGIGATVGSVIPTQGAIIPAAVGVDIGCGMMAVRDHARRRATCPTTWRRCARAIERAVPHGRTDDGGRGDRGAWHDAAGARRRGRGRSSSPSFERIVDKHPTLEQRQRRSSTSARSAPATTSSRSASTRRTASGSCCTRGSRGVGNRIGTLLHRAGQAGHERSTSRTCPTATSPTSTEGSEHFDDYVRGRRLGAGLRAHEPRADDARACSTRCAQHGACPPFAARREAVNCHHNYVAQRAPLRRGRVRDAQGRGARAARASSASSRAAWARARYIVRGKGNPERFTVVQPRRGPRDVAQRGEAALHASRTTRARPQGVECRKDADVIDETPDGLQGHRRRDGGAERPGRGRAHAQAGGVREGVNGPQRAVPSQGRISIVSGTGGNDGELTLARYGVLSAR